MKYTYLLFLTALLFSCATSEAELDFDDSIDSTVVEEEYFFEFVLKDNVYNLEEQQTYLFDAEQDLSFDLIFKDIVYDSKYMYYAGNTSEDSIDISAIIRFVNPEIPELETSLIDIEILVTEDKSNLTAVSDSTYVYNSLEPFYNQLLSKNFGHKNIFLANTDKSQLFVSFPENNLLDSSWGMSPNFSQGFYFENEQLEFTNISFDQFENNITLEGNFEVEIKFLSCGFYSTHRLESANFNLLIK